MKKFLLAGAALAALTAGAQAADLAAPRTPIAAAVVAPLFNWSGPYIGAFIGGAWGSTRHDFDPGTHGSVNASGIVGGVFVGYNWQVNSFVLGAEADFGLSGLRNSTAAFCCFTDQKWVGSLRGRAGVAVDRVLLYATGGVAFAGIRAGEPGFAVGTTTTRAGWTVGAGIEAAITPNWTVRAEYLYADYGRWVGYGQGILPHQVTLKTHTVRAGVSYLFSTGGGAVVARY